MSKKNLLLKCCAALAAAALLVAGLRLYDDTRVKLRRQTRFMMDTYVTIAVNAPKKKAFAAINRAMDRIGDIDRKMNALNPDSPLYAFNHRGTPIEDPEVVGLVDACIRANRLTGGAFDITLLPVSTLWGFNSDASRRKVPSDEEITAALAKTGIRHLSVRDGRVYRDNDTATVDLGGAAKGYSVGEAVKALKAEGITSALIDAGGDLFAVGTNNGRPWKAGVRGPRGGLLGSVELEGLSVACSGDYERYFIENGKRYHHVLSPATGRPAGGASAAVIVYDDCTLTDIMTKALFILGPDRGMRLVESIPGMEGIFVSDTGEKFFSKGLKSKFNAVNE